jgi:hypothetical protein
MKKKDEVAKGETMGIMAGLQLAIFELIWGSYDWTERIYLRMGEKSVEVYFECKREPPDEQWESCCYLIDEMLDVMFENDRLRDISWKLERPSNEEFVEIMSDSIFREIAKSLAPWRLSE